ncbi:NADP-dependent oxidoreductase [Chloroflexi bacterium TSY]|nr:NADP-dependent oxidoreductase [Chloroflexi bacterium TSY]
MVKSREIHLKQRPVGLPTESDFEVITVSLPDPRENEILVRNCYMSVDPYMRGCMIDRKSYTPPFQIGEVLAGGCVGEVIQSNNQDFSEGDYVTSMMGWREYFVSEGDGLRKVDPNLASIQSFLGAMGMPGQTGYFGLLDIGEPQEGETVFVSAAAGAVGSIVCQIAKIKGCQVVGSAGSAAKVAWLRDEVGIDAAFNYKEADDLTKEVAQYCPDGIDIYFENVGGQHLVTALTLMNNHGRIPVCGMISQYNATDPVPGPSNLGTIIGKRIKMQGFIVSDYMSRSSEFYADMSTWTKEGKMQWRETIHEGIEQAPAAFIGLFSGENFGKMLVKI